MSFSDWVRQVAIGLYAGAVAGFVCGIGARIAMRLVILSTERMPSFTLEGTAGILILGMIVGIVPGIVFMLFQRFIAGHLLVKALVFGLLLLLVLGAPVLLGPAEGELALGPPWLGRSLFAALFPLYGLTLAGAVWTLGRLVRRDPLGPARPIGEPGTAPLTRREAN